MKFLLFFFLSLLLNCNDLIKTSDYTQLDPSSNETKEDNISETFNKANNETELKNYIQALKDEGLTDVEIFLKIKELIISDKDFVNSLKGDQGIQGEKGDQGIQGIQGLKGDQGIQGIQGAIGDKGEDGIQGVQGIQGLSGDQGIQGKKGDQGIQGIQGLKGDQGIQGIQGEKGDQGIQGEKGDQGIQGLKGDKGDDGADLLYKMTDTHFCSLSSTPSMTFGNINYNLSSCTITEYIGNNVDMSCSSIISFHDYSFTIISSYKSFPGYLFGKISTIIGSFICEFDNSAKQIKCEILTDSKITTGLIDCN